MTGMRGTSLTYDYDFYVLFVGLVAWVPRVRSAAYGPIMDAGATAVLPWVQEDDCDGQYKLQGAGQLPTHFARWTLIAGTCEPCAHCPAQNERVSWGARKLLGKHGQKPPRYQDLKRESLYFNFPGETIHPFTRIRGLRSADDHSPKYRESALDLDWVPPMGDICQSQQLKRYLEGAEVVHPDCLKGGAGTPARVAALVQLTSGSLMTAMLTEIGGRAPIFTAKPITMDLCWDVDRTLTEYVLWHVEVSDPNKEGVSLIKDPFDPITKSEMLTLKPKKFLGDPVSCINKPHESPLPTWIQ